jgi:hypothetical protein
MTFLKPQSSIRRGTTSSRYLSFNLAILLDHLAAHAAEPDFPSVLQLFIAGAGGLIAFVAYQHDIGDIQGRFQVNDASLPHRPSGFGMLFHEVNAFNDDLLFVGIGKTDLALFPSILAGDDQHGIVFPDFHKIIYPSR